MNKKMCKVLSVVAAISMMTVSAVSVASAKTKPDRGTWDYGCNVFMGLYSNYIDSIDYCDDWSGNAWYSATVINAKDESKSSTQTNYVTKAYAKINGKVFSRNDRAYYNHW